MSTSHQPAPHTTALSPLQISEMPGKHVRFNSSNIEYSPAPVPYSPAFSDDSLPSSSGPLTPPSAFAQNISLPGAHVQPLVPVHIHPCLGVQMTSPHLLYDVSLPTSSVRLNDMARSRVPAQLMVEPATQPPLPYLIIHCQSPAWRITVTASTPLLGVSCADVFEGIYRSLRLAVSAPEYNSLPSPDAQKRVSLAYQERCSRLRHSEEREAEKRKGLKRIDFLVGHNRFMGLASTKEGPHIWTLHTA